MRVLNTHIAMPLLATLVTWQLNAQPVQKKINISQGNVQVYISKQKVQVAEEIRVSVLVPKVLYKGVNLDDDQVLLEHSEGEEGEKLPLSQYTKFEQSEDRDFFRLVAGIKFFQPGKHPLPVKQLNLVNKEGKPVAFEHATPGIEVTSLIQKDQQSDYELYDVMMIERSYVNLLIALLVIALVVLLLVLLRKQLVAVIKNLFTRKTGEAPVETNLTAHEKLQVFMAKVETIENRANQDSHALTACAEELEIEFRQFISDLFGFNARSHTFKSLVRRFQRQQIAIASKTVDDLQDMFNQWMLFNYAKRQAAAGDVHLLISRSKLVGRELVESNFKHSVPEPADTNQ